MASTTIDGPAPVTRGGDWPPLPESERRPLHRAVLAALGPVRGARLLDVGCGVGLLMRSAHCRGALVAGVDTAAEPLEIARWALPEADLRVAAPDSLPFADDAFDVATACTALPPGAGDRAAVLGELVRVVRPGGRVAVGGWVWPEGCWVQEFGARLRRLSPGEPADLTADLGPAADLRAAGLTVAATGDVACPVVYPSRTAAWAALLGSERLLLTMRLVGAGAVHDAFRASVEPVVADDGTVRLARTFRYAVAAAAPRPVTDRDISVTASFVGSGG